MLVGVESDLASEPGAASTCLISQRDKIWSSQKVSTQSWQLWPRGRCCMLVHVKSGMASEPGAASTCSKTSLYVKIRPSQTLFT